MFVGRQSELDALLAARRALGRSRGSFVLIEGDAGIGKSRLIAQFVRNLGDRRVRNLAIAECMEGSVEPLRPIRAICEALLLSAEPPSLSADAESALVRIVPNYGSEAQIAQPGLIDRGDFFNGLCDVFAAFAAKRATIAIVEDIHWADTSTLDFLAHLAGRVGCTRLLVLASYRSDAMEANKSLLRVIARIEREASVHRIALEPFDSGDVRKLVDGALDGRANVSVETLDDITARSEGNPFFAEELLKDALARGPRHAARLPISIRGTIVERLARFDADERRVLAFAAVLGLRFDPALLAELIDGGMQRLRPVLQRARDVSIVIEDPRSRSSLQFRHALTRQVIYEELLTFDARRVHQRIVETLESRNDSASDFTLAEHAAAAGDETRTLLYGERAGSASLALGGFAEATTCFERALRAATDEGDQARLLERLGFAASYGDKVQHGVDQWERAREIRTRRGEHTDAARLLVLIVCERFNLGKLPDAGEFALAYVDRHGDAIAQRTRDGMFVLIARLRSILCRFEGIDALIERIDDPRERLTPESMQSFIIAKLNRASYFGRVEEWRACANELRSLPPIDPAPSTDAINVAVYSAAVVASGLALGTPSEIEAAGSRSRTLATQWGFAHVSAYAHALDAVYHTYGGRLSAARASFRLASRGRVNGPAAASLALCAPLLAIALDDDSFVNDSMPIDFLQAQREAVRNNPSALYERLTIGGYGVWLAARNRMPEALMFLHEALHGIMFPSPPFAATITFALRHLDIALIPGLDMFADAGRLSQDDAVGRATATLCAASNSLRAGSLDAVRALRDAADSYERAGHPLFAAHAFYVAGSYDDAQTLYARCDAVAYVRPSESERSAPILRDASLSERERSVADFVTLGLTNGAIAERMSVSTKTVEKHVASIFGKLGVRSRTQIAAHIAARRLGGVVTARSGDAGSEVSSMRR